MDWEKCLASFVCKFPFGAHTKVYIKKALLKASGKMVPYHMCSQMGLRSECENHVSSITTEIQTPQTTSNAQWEFHELALNN